METIETRLANIRQNMAESASQRWYRVGEGFDQVRMRLARCKDSRDHMWLYGQLAEVFEIPEDKRESVYGMLLSLDAKYGATAMWADLTETDQQAIIDTHIL